MVFVTGSEVNLLNVRWQAGLVRRVMMSQLRYCMSTSIGGLPLFIHGMSEPPSLVAVRLSFMLNRRLATAFVSVIRHFWNVPDKEDDVRCGYNFLTVLTTSLANSHAYSIHLYTSSITRDPLSTPLYPYQA
jgi:hypothetical protein